MTRTKHMKKTLLLFAVTAMLFAAPVSKASDRAPTENALVIKGIPDANVILHEIQIVAPSENLECYIMELPSVDMCENYVITLAELPAFQNISSSFSKAPPGTARTVLYTKSKGYPWSVDGFYNCSLNINCYSQG